MRCPACAFSETQVIDSRELEDGAVTRRRRKCLRCSARFTTYERGEPLQLQVVKKDGRREPYSRDKLFRNTLKALEKRPVSSEAVDAFLRTIELQLHELGKLEVSSRQIGELVLNGLKELDPVAYIRFASVYVGFADLDSMKREVDTLLGQHRVTDDGPPPP